MMTKLDIKLTKTIPAEREDVFSAWLNAELLAKFMRPMPGGTATAKCDPRVGGAFHIVMIAGDKQYPHTGNYTVIDPHERLAFTWISDATNHTESLVTLDFKTVGENATELTLTHAGLPDEAQCENHRTGWATILDLVESVVD